MPQRVKTDYPGVWCRELPRIGGRGNEKVFYIRFKQNGKTCEEKAGRQYVDNMTPAKAARMRGERIEGRRKSPRELRAEREQVRISVKHRWTFDRIWEEYRGVKTIKRLSTDESRYRKHLSSQFGNRVPSELTPSDIDQVRVQLLKKYSPQTVAHVLSLLRRLVNFARQRRLCDIPDFKIELPKVNNEKTEDLTPEQLQRLLDAIEEAPNRKAASIMKLALFTGMRRGEILNLKWEDIGGNGFVTIRIPKGGTDQRIPLNPLALAVIESQPKTSDYVFPGHNGRQIVSIRREVNRIKKAAGLPEDFRPLHGLRHVYASMLASNGVDLYTLQKLLTHKSPAMTQRYAHLRDEALRNASNLVVDILTNAIAIPETRHKTAQTSTESHDPNTHR